MPNQEPRWLTLARAYIGLHEGVGPADNPKVVEFFKLAGHPEIKHDSVPWCAAFAGAMLKLAGLKPTGTLWALDYAKWGQPLAHPVLGCVVAKSRLGGGHVGFVVGANASQLFVLGGNESDQVMVEAIARDSSIKAYRWPAGVPLPSPELPLPTTIAGARTGGSEA